MHAHTHTCTVYFKIKIRAYCTYSVTFFLTSIPKISLRVRVPRATSFFNQLCGFPSCVCAIIQLTGWLSACISFCSCFSKHLAQMSLFPSISISVRDPGSRLEGVYAYILTHTTKSSINLHWKPVGNADFIFSFPSDKRKLKGFAVDKKFWFCFLRVFFES